MDDQQRLMHGHGAPATMAHGMSQGYMQTVDPSQPPHDQENTKREIGEILQQIMNITDQSLDEAQAR